MAFNPGLSCIQTKRRTLFLAAFMLLASTASLWAGDSEQAIEYITINDGLSGNYVTQIHQDRYGYLWFGTMEGLNRYDGQSFVTFQSRPGDSLSLSDNFIRSIDEDGDGNLYIATNTCGLNFFDRHGEYFQQIVLKDSSGRFFESLSTVNYLNDSCIWIGTQDSYILSYNPVSDQVVWSGRVDLDFPNASKNIINDVYVDRAGTLWIASGLGGLDRMTTPAHTLEHVLLADTLSDRFRRNGCNNLIENEDGTFWISRVGGLDRFNPSSGLHKSYDFLDSKGEMLKGFSVQSYPDGSLILNSYYDLIRFDPQQEKYSLVASVLPHYLTTALYIDNNGIIWSGSMGYGIVKIDPIQSQFNTEAGNFLGAVYDTELKLLKGYEGLDLSLRDRDFLSIIRGQRQDTWIATQFWGLFHIDPAGTTVKKYSMGKLDLRQRYQVMYEVFQDHAGEIWVSTVGGISQLDQDSGTFEYHRLYPGSETNTFALNKATYIDISCMYEDTEGIFWLGTPELGLIRYDPHQHDISYYPVSWSKSRQSDSYPILSILPDPERPDQILWLGTEGGGLVKFIKSNASLQFFNQKDGLPSNTVNGVLAGSTFHLWMSTNMGISQFFPSSGRFQNFDVRDGLQSNGFNRREFLKTPEGELYFGGTYGYNHFFPEVIETSHTPSPLILTGIDLLNKPIHFDDPNSPLTAPLDLLESLILDHKQAMMVTFYFSALSYSRPHRDRFTYKLDGFDQNWIDNGVKRSAVYTKLPPGHYKFRVRHEADGELANTTALSIGLTILPPFWASWWFRSLLIFTLLSLVYLFMRQQLNRHKNERQEQQRFSQKLIEYQEDERKRISGELHDSVGQNLLVIKNTLQLGMNQLSETKASTEYFNSASDIVSETIQEVRNISHNLSPQHLENLGLTSTLESAIETIERASNIRFLMELDNIDGLLPPTSEILVYRIVQEGLNNILKHSQASAVEINVRREERLIRILIRDNGIGFPPSKAISGRGIGLSGMKERAQLLQGQIRFNGEPGKGTSVELTIQLEA